MRFITILTLIFLMTIEVSAQYNLKGRVLDSKNQEPVENVRIYIEDLDIFTITDSSGEFSFRAIKKPDINLRIDGINIKKKNIMLSFSKEKELNYNITVDRIDYLFDEVVVYIASKKSEKITESPASISVMNSSDISAISGKGQIAKAVENMTGVDILQSGSSDFIVNSRGFNNGLNRRILVLQDGRDVAMPLLGAQEWNSFSYPLEDYSKIEFVRGPAASLYGANAFNGVMNLTTYSPKEIIGTKLSVSAGDYNYKQADLRHAGILKKMSYKLSLGYRQNRNLIGRRDSLKFLEYSGLAIERRTIADEDRNTFSGYGAFRIDYDLDEESRIVSEFGYSRSGDETYVFGLGRTFVQDVARPYARLGYNSKDLNIHMHYMQRETIDTMWLLVPNAPLLDNSKDLVADIQYNFEIGNISIVSGIMNQIQLIRTFGTSIPYDVDANYQGAYSQLDWKLNNNFKFVGSVRFDRSNIHSVQFSPRIAVVYFPEKENQIRISFGRSFQRPNYSELYRRTPDAPAFTSLGAPVNFKAIENKIADSIFVLSGKRPAINLNIDSRRAMAVGNPDLKVEKNLGFEIGYKGIFSNSLFITADFYYNRLSDFITNFLPSVNKSIPAWKADLPADISQYNSLAEAMVYNSLNIRDKKRLSVYEGLPVFVVSNANVGKVDQSGFDLGFNYYLTSNFTLSGSYSYYSYKIVESEINQPLLPNTAPNKFNLSMNYKKIDVYDFTISVRYSAKFDWLAGTYVGTVPEYFIANFSGNIRLRENLSLGTSISNIFNRKYYEIFGGTYLPRNFILKLTAEI